MLDNFGMGEFLVLALFALLFFGPARLPQIGAQLGRWLSKLTTYSRAFMTQWSEEAAAVQGAVQDVMTIRDEIRAAQAEIAESLNAAQKDISETISVAKGTIQQATPTAAGFMAAGGAPALANAEDANRFQGSMNRASDRDDGQAVSKTQDIVNSLLIKQGVVPPPEPAAEEEAESVAPAPGAPAEDEAYQKNLAAIQEIMGRSKETVPGGAVPASEETPALEAQQDQAAAPPAEAAEEVSTQPGSLFSGSIAAGLKTAGQQALGETKPKREQTESAFSKTQRILNQLMGIEPEPEPEPEPDLPPESPAPTPVEGTTVESARPVLPAAEADTQAVAETPAAAGPATTRPVDAVQHVRGSVTGVSMGEFTKLSIEVGLLKRELQTLRKELQTLRAEEPAQAVAEPLPGDETAAQPGDNSPARPVETVA